MAGLSKDVSYVGMDIFWMKYNCIEVNLVDITKETEES